MNFSRLLTRAPRASHAELRPAAGSSGAAWRSLVFVAGTLATVLNLAACNRGGSDRVPPTGPQVTQGITGTVVFEKVEAGIGGLGANASAVRLPVRFARVDIVLDTNGTLSVLARTATDAQGRYGIGGSFPAGAQVLVSSTTEDVLPPNRVVRVRVTDNPLGAPGDPSSTYGVISPALAAVTGADLLTVDIVAPIAGAERAAGAFNILDVLTSSAETWFSSTGVVPNLCEARWRRGQQPRTSFFDSGTNRITILGGVAGLENRTDTDEFDDSVLAHEYNHFAVRNHAASSSPGGQHGGEELVPALAYDEALANWYSSVVRESSFYVDTIGSADGATRCGYCDDLEQLSAQRVRGIGSEQTIMEVLWDLVDGSPELPDDRDGDGLRLSPSDVLAAVLSYRGIGDVIHVTTLFDALVARGVVSVAGISQLLRTPENQELSYPPTARDAPPTGRDVYPIPLARGSQLRGSVDAFVDGNPSRGFNSQRHYAVDLAGGGTIRVTLTIDNGGAAPRDLDLYVRDTRNGVFARSETENAIETLTVGPLGPGRYIIEVRGYFEANDGTVVRNRADYSLRVE